MTTKAQPKKSKTNNEIDVKNKWVLRYVEDTDSGIDLNDATYNDENSGITMSLVYVGGFSAERQDFHLVMRVQQSSPFKSAADLGHLPLSKAKTLAEWILKKVSEIDVEKPKKNNKM